MNWDEMMSAADESIAEYYRRYPTAYSEVEFNNVELLYVPEVDSAGDMQYVPAWVFTQTEGGDVLDAGKWAYITGGIHKCVRRQIY